MNKSVLIFSLVISSILFLSFIIIFSYEAITTYQAHETFLGYCTWRGLIPVNLTLDYGYCENLQGQTYRIVMLHGRWYLDGDLPGSGLF